ncbi:unnamed protein product [Rotaria magnacalcarata]
MSQFSIRRNEIKRNTVSTVSLPSEILTPVNTILALRSCSKRLKNSRLHILRVSFIFGLIGMATGISYFNSSSVVTLGAAAGVSIVGVILNFIGAIVAGFIRAA